MRFLAPARLPHHRSTTWYRLLNRLEHRLFDASCEPDRRDTLKCQMSYGWDFAPELRTIGLWDDVEVVVTGQVTLFDMQVKTRLVPGRVAIQDIPASYASFSFVIDAPPSTAKASRPYCV